MCYILINFLFIWAIEIWDALRAAAEADLSLAQAIVDSAGVIVQNADLTVCYDERGRLFSCLPFSALIVDAFRRLMLSYFRCKV